MYLTELKTLQSLPSLLQEVRIGCEMSVTKAGAGKDEHVRPTFLGGRAGKSLNGYINEEYQHQCQLHDQGREMTIDVHISW